MTDHGSVWPQLEDLLPHVRKAARYIGGEWNSQVRDPAAADLKVDIEWYTSRERDVREVLPCDYLFAGVEKDWLWRDWGRASREVDFEDGRTGCPVLEAVMVEPGTPSLVPLTERQTPTERMSA